MEQSLQEEFKNTGLKANRVTLRDIHIPNSVEDMPKLRRAVAPDDDRAVDWQRPPPPPSFGAGMLLMLLAFGAFAIGGLMSYQNIEDKKVLFICSTPAALD